MPLSSSGYSVLSTAPPLCFALGGLATPSMLRRAGLATTTLACLALMLAGHLTRSLASDFSLFFAASIAIFLGMGIGNVLLPPIVKRYFPRRIAQVSTAYITVLAISTFVPPLAAVPLADAGSWRWSLATWGVLTAVAVVPWVALAFVGRGTTIERVRANPSRGRASSAAAWALAVAFGVSTLNAYAAFAWLPSILTARAGFTDQQAGAALALYSILALPFALVIPSWTMRMQRPAGIAVAAGVALVVGNSLLAVGPPSVMLLGVVIAGLGPVLFPLCITLIMRLSATADDAARLGGFSQALGYALGALGPLLVGILFSVTSEWTLSLLFLAATGAAAIAAAAVLYRVVPPAPRA